MKIKLTHISTYPHMPALFCLNSKLRKLFFYFNLLIKGEGTIVKNDDDYY